MSASNKLKKKPSANKTKVVASQKFYDELVEEVDTVTEELTKVRKELWKAQDDLKKVGPSDKTLLKQLRERDDEIKMLRETHATSIEQEQKAQDNLAKIKNLYAASNIQNQKDESTIRKLRKELKAQEKEIATLRQALATAELEKEDLANCLLKDCADDEDDILKKKLKQARRDLQNEKTRTRLYITELHDLKERMNGGDDDSSCMEESVPVDPNGKKVNSKEMVTLRRQIQDLKEELEYNSNGNNGSYLDSLANAVESSPAMSGLLSKLGFGSYTFDDDEREERVTARDPWGC